MSGKSRAGCGDLSKRAGWRILQVDQTSSSYGSSIKNRRSNSGSGGCVG